MVKRKKGKKEIMIIIAVLLAGIAVSYFFTLPLLFYVLALGQNGVFDAGTLQILSSLAFALFVAFWYIAYRLIQNQNVEFEYAFTNGELDVDKVVAKRRRKKILTVPVRNFEILARTGGGKFNDYYRSLPKIEASSGNFENTYFAVYSKEGEKKCLVFDPPKRMIDAIKQYCQRGVVEDQ